MEQEKIIVHAPDYLVDRLNAALGGTVHKIGGEERTTGRGYKIIEAMVGGTRKFVAEIYPDEEMGTCTDDELKTILDCVKRQGLIVLENPEIVG